MRKTYKTIDLSAGMGGILKGFERTGYFTNVLSSEIDKYACKTYEHLFGENPNNDLTKEPFKKLVEKVLYDILLAGFTCQPFSRAGLDEGFDDKKRGGFFCYCRNNRKNTPLCCVFGECRSLHAIR